MSSAVTEGIHIQVQSEFRPERSSAGSRHYLFTYTVRIANEGATPATLVARHWIITDASGEREEVVGDGVVGQQPRLETGATFEYTSYCVIKTPVGSMQGTYRMTRDDGSSFEARIAPFSLVVPGALN